VDTSVWMEHLKNRNRSLVTLLEAGRVLCHPFIVGEISSLSLRQQGEILDRLERLPQVGMATHKEVLTLIEIHGLRGEDLSWVDLQLLASVRLSTCYLWTLDPVLHSAAHMLNVSV
jgi:hypothetical protein